MTDPNMPGVLTTLGSDPTADTRQMAYEVVREAAKAGHPLYFVWGSGDTGDHKRGIAIDFMVYAKGGGVKKPGPIRAEVGSWIANYVWANRERLGVHYEIYNHRIRSKTGPGPNTWIDYFGSDPHENHVHVSRLASGAPKYKAPAVAAAVPGSDWPSKGWATVSVKGDKVPHLNGRVAPNFNAKIKHVRKDGFSIYYTSKVKNKDGVWLRTRYGTYYCVGHDIVKGRKTK